MAAYQMNEKETQALEYLWTRTWWTFVILGLIAVALGVFALVSPQASAALPVQLLGVFIALDGLFKIITAVIDRRYQRGTRIAGGALEIVIGLLIFIFSLQIVTVAFTFILYLVGIGFLISGGVSILQTIQGRREWTSILTGALQLGFGVLLFVITEAAAVTLIWITGLFLFGIGAVLLVVGFRMRQLGSRLRPMVHGDVVEGQVVEGSVVESEVVEVDVMQLPDHTDR